MENNKEAPKSATDEAREILAAIQKEKAELQEWTLRAEKSKAEQMLSGKADAGQVPEPIKEMTNKEYLDSLKKGVIPPKVTV